MNQYSGIGARTKTIAIQGNPELTLAFQYRSFAENILRIIHHKMFRKIDLLKIYSKQNLASLPDLTYLPTMVITLPED